MADDRSRPDTLEGTLERILYQHPETQWTVARIRTDGPGGAADVPAVGALLGVQLGTELSLQGEWVDDKKYGRQFKVSSYQTKTPETKKGIERYLGSGMVPGIGPELAKRIVGAFGLDTFEVIARNSGRLTEVDGIGPSRASSIAGAFVEQRDIQDVMVFLRGHGVSTAFAIRIYKRYGKDAVGVVRQNPYRLALDVWGIGFKTADAIARSLGLATDAPERLEAGLVHVLGELTEDGHTHVPESHLLDTAAELLAVSPDGLPAALDRLESSQLVVRETLGERGPCASLTATWEAEQAAAASVARLRKTARAGLDGNIPAALKRLEGEGSITLAAAQKDAVTAAVTDPLVVITGGPGVGKTTIIRAVVQLLSAGRFRLSLCAPTGRAAKRLSESTGMSALTIHRLLEFNPRTGGPGGGFERNEERPLETDVVIVDEASMVDVLLFRSLLAALPSGTRLVLVGDIDQLPSIGPGSVLEDMIRSGAATVVRLTEIFRQAAASAIITNAHRINQGELPELSPPAGDDPNRSDFYFIERDDPIAARNVVVEMVAERIPKRFGFDPILDVQVLTPMHRGELGTMTLNAELQKRLNPESRDPRAVKRGGRTFRAGDKVMQIRNSYDRDVYNGDIGVVAYIADDEASMTVELLDGRRVDYEAGELDELVHGFAVSVHKSQGSEYPVVVVPLMTQHYMMLQRNLLYTALTRGKKLVVVVGQKRALKMAVDNASNKQRWTWLAERIAQAPSAEA